MTELTVICFDIGDNRDQNERGLRKGKDDGDLSAYRSKLKETFRREVGTATAPWPSSDGCSRPRRQHLAVLFTTAFYSSTEDALQASGNLT